MKQWLVNRKAFILIVLLGVVFYTADFNYAMLSFILFWQTLVIIFIFNTCTLYLKTRKGQYVIGKLIESKENQNTEQIRYELLIEFSFPSEENKYQLKHQSDLWPMKLYKIWVNKINPEKSVVMEDITIQLSKIVIAGFFVSILFYFDYLYLLKILSS